MDLTKAYEYLDASTCENIFFEEASKACIVSAGESALPDHFSGMDKDPEFFQAVSEVYEEKRIETLRAFCTAFVDKARTLTDDLAREIKEAKKSKGENSLREASFKAHQILFPMQELALFMADIDLVCINGLYLASIKIQKKLSSVGRMAADKYNSGNSYSDKIGQKADLETRRYSYAEMLVFPSGQRPKFLKKKKY